MKRLPLILLVLGLFFAVAIAVVPADYYIPLQVGNQLVYRSGTEGGEWSLRTVYETIEGADSLFGHIFYRQVGMEIMDDQPNDEHIFHVFWLREDSLGNILIGAVGMSDSSATLDSALIYPMEYTMFFPERYEPGFGMRNYYGGMDCLDSTISNTETVTTHAGNYYNCIKMMSQRIDTTADSLTWEEDVYYAENIGEIKKERIFPDPHIKLLQHVNFQIAIDERAPDDHHLGQNYPNPFNPLTTIEYRLPVEADVVISIYDLKGKKVIDLVNMQRKAGYHKVIWNALDIPSGIYVYVLKVDKVVLDQKKMCILK